MIAADGLPILVVFSGLPGTGKTSVARPLAARLHALYLRIDAIEQAMRDAGVSEVGVAGYAVANAVAEANLRLGRSVVLLRHEAAPLAKVLEYPLLSPDWHVGLQRAIMEEAERRHLTVRLAPEAEGVHNMITLLAMAAAGLGVCIHPRAFIPHELKPTIGMVAFADCEIVRTFGIVTADHRPLSPSVRRFRDFLRTAGKAASDTP